MVHVPSTRQCVARNDIYRNSKHTSLAVVAYGCVLILSASGTAASRNIRVATFARAAPPPPPPVSVTCSQVTRAGGARARPASAIHLEHVADPVDEVVEVD
eukprot:scaffold119710_cov63-Phaeocystis_antarctica.AAC.2